MKYLEMWWLLCCVFLMVGTSESAEQCLERFMNLSLIQLRASRVEIKRPIEIERMDEEIRIMTNIQFTCATQIDSVILGVDIREMTGMRDKYPSVQLWRPDVGEDNEIQLVTGSERTIQNTTFSSTGIHEYPLSPPITANSGDYLAVSQPKQMESIVRVYTVDGQQGSSYVAQGNEFGSAMLDRDSEDLTNVLVLLYPSTSQFNCLTTTQSDLKSFVKEQSLLIAESEKVKDQQQYIYPDMKFMCNGMINKWIYAGESEPSRTANPELQVWRLLPGYTDTYDKIGSSQVIANETDPNSNVHEFTVDPPIEFMEGDVFGLYQPDKDTSALQIYEQKESGPVNYRYDTKTLSLPLADIVLSTQFTLDKNDYPLVTMEISQYTTGIFSNTTATQLSQTVTTSINTTQDPVSMTTISSTINTTIQISSITTSSVTTITTDSSAVSTSTISKQMPSTHEMATISSRTQPTVSMTVISLSMGTSSSSNVSSSINATVSLAPFIDNTPRLVGALAAIGLLIVTIIVCTAIVVAVLIWRKKVDIKRNEEGMIINGKANGYDEEQALSNPVYGSGDTDVASSGRNRYKDMEVLSNTPSLHHGGSTSATGRSMMPPPLHQSVIPTESQTDNSESNAIYSEVNEEQRFQPSHTSSSFTQDQPPQTCQHYEWNIVVPTLDERRRINNSFKDFRDAVTSQYSTVESCSQYADSSYQFLDHSVPGHSFFEESNIYWAPGSDYGSLYEQLSSRKFREILSSHISMSNLLGSGQFGVVMKGTWTSPNGVIPVAIKTVKQDAVEEEKVKFLQEAAIMGQFHHPNIIQIHGVVTMSEPTMIVLELMHDGDLHSYLKGLKPSPGEMVAPSIPELLLSFCRQVASAMEYLSNKSFIHRDIAARNVLVTNKKTCKISDFGMSRDLQEETYYISKGGQIPIKWTAPEALSYKKYSTASDVWSYGVLMYEIWSLGGKPWQLTTNQQVFRKVCDGHRLPPPPGCPRKIYEMMIKCWNPEYSFRPSFSNLMVDLSDSDHKLLEVCPSSGNRRTPLHPQSCVLGAPVEAGHDLYPELQLMYRSSQ